MLNKQAGLVVHPVDVPSPLQPPLTLSAPPPHPSPPPSPAPAPGARPLERHPRPRPAPPHAAAADRRPARLGPRLSLLRPAPRRVWLGAPARCGAPPRQAEGAPPPPPPPPAALRTHGYQLVPMRLGVTVDEVDATPAAGWHPIFNAEPMYGEFQAQSTGRESTGELSPACCSEVQRALAEADLLFPGQTVTHVVGVKSLPGCQKQAAHVDMDPAHPIFQQTWEHVPKGVLYFPDGGQFCVYPAGLSCQAPPIVVQVPPRIAVVFRSDLRHSGAPYPGGNRRVFSYVDVPGHSRFVLRDGELTTDVSYPCVPGGEHQKGCPLAAATRLTEAAMRPDSTLTTRRLDLSLGHLPMPPLTERARPRCQLHFLRERRRICSPHVGRCNVCNVLLCLSCFASFHVDRDPMPAKCPPAP